MTATYRSTTLLNLPGPETDPLLLVESGTISNRTKRLLCQNLTATDNFLARVDLNTGEFFQPMCRNNQCPACAAWKVRMIERALHRVAPGHMVTLHWVGAAWGEICRNLTRYRRLVRSAGVRVEDMACVEPYKKANHHIHLLVHGDPLPYELADESAKRAGMMRAWVEPITHHRFLTYGLKQAMDPATLPVYLQCNNGQLSHPTKKFWRNGPGGPVVRGGYLALARSPRREPPEDFTSEWKYVRIGDPPARQVLPDYPDLRAHRALIASGGRRGR